MNTNFQRISPLWETFPTVQAGEAARPKAAEGSVFKDVLQAVVDNVRQSEDEVAKKEYLLSTGQLADAHTLPIAEAKAGLTVDVLLTLRNKTLEAYNELIKINV